MEFYYKKFSTERFTLYPIGDFHLGSRQCNEKFVKQIIEEIAYTDHAYWVGMGDMMENAVVGSKSDVYTQTLPPKEQMEHIVELLMPIKEKGLFVIGGNHEQRTHRLVGLTPEEYIAIQTGVPYKGFSCLARFILNCNSGHPRSFSAYFHHNYGGGFTPGGKINKANQLRKIAPTVDAAFCAHFHITSRIPVTWFEAGKARVIKHTGYDYITGSALGWPDSYAEEKAKPAATMEFIKVTFIRPTTWGRGDRKESFHDNREQLYEIISPRGR